MKRYISYIFGTLTVALVASCMNVDLQPIDNPAMVNLTLKSTELVPTRATQDAVPNLNENLINSVQCFFSNDGKTILFDAYKSGLNESDGTVDNLNLEISAADITNLNNSCQVYAVVNCDRIALPADKKISTLKATEITLAKKNDKQDSFVMVGSASLTKTDTKISGEVQVKRVAAKINVILDIKETINVQNGENTEIWQPYFDQGMKLSFNGMTASTLGHADIQTGFTSTDPYGFQQTELNIPAAAADGVYRITMSVPFYTYPMEWGSDKEQNITLHLPWKQMDGEIVKRYDTYTYQIPVQYSNRKLISNNVYELTVNVGVLGSLGTIDLTPNYVVTDWGTGELDAELSRPKYLVVEKQNHVIDGDTYHYVMNNTTELTIPFHSSDNCEITSVTCTKINLTGNDVSITRNNAATAVTNKSYKAVLNNDTNTISIVHGLNNNLYDSTNDDNGVFDFTPYIYELVVSHIGNASFTETIMVIQYPAMYGALQVNSGSSNKGYTFVNGYQNAPSGTQTGFCNVACSPSGSGVSSNAMTIVTFTSLAGTDYILGDPRTTSVDQGLIARYTWKSSTALYDAENNRGLEYYYPAQRDLSLGASHPTHNMVAPKFRICSGYGAIDGNMERRQYLEYMEGRCASYQEDGYPAGRWRLPTKAELEIINTLCEKGLLPDLFADIPYWTAHGYGQYSSSNNKVNMTYSGDRGNTSVSVRCVYDEWYWGSEQIENKNQFTWGDEPREN